jgi:hypothetical protein
MEPEQMLTTNNIHPGIRTRLTTAGLLGRSTVFSSASDCSPCWARTGSVTKGVDAAGYHAERVAQPGSPAPIRWAGLAHPPSRHCRCGGQVPRCYQQSVAALRWRLLGRLVTGPFHRHQPKAAPHLQWQPLPSAPRRPVQNHPEGAIPTAGIYARKVGVVA